MTNLLMYRAGMTAVGACSYGEEAAGSEVILRSRLAQLC